MKVFVLFLLYAAVCSAEWTRMTTPNFELYTNAGERDSRQTLETFEQVRDFFMRTRSSQVTTRLPVTIVGFRSMKDYKPYGKEGAIAYYTGDEQHDYVVMGELGAEYTNVAIHEYVHLLVRHSGLKFPVWLNEGFSEVYSTLRPLGGKILMGTPSHNSQVLNRDKWLPIDRLMAIDMNSPEYNEGSRMGILYAQGWLLTHMLMLGDGYRDKFSDFALRISQTGSAEDAFQAIYGKKLSQVEKEMRAYANSALKGALFATKFEKFTVESGRPATDLESEIVLTRLSAMRGKKMEAMARLERLVLQYPSNFEPEEALAYVAWRSGEADAAKEHLSLAIQKGATNWKTHWDFARLAYGDRSDKRALLALDKAIRGNPDLVDAKLMLAYRLLENKTYAQALVAFRNIRKIDPERAPSMLLAIAHCASRLGLNSEALANAEAAKKHAKTDKDIQAAANLIQYLKRGETAKGEVETDERPVLARYVPPPAESRMESNPAPAMSAKGRLTKLDCLAGPARMHVLVNGEKRRYIIRDPNRIVIRGDAGSVNMTCGEQDTPLVVEFQPAEDKDLDTSGEVVALEFVKP